ncbi:uncharacterized protein LOC128236091 [Mya arenaria]|uniref:uncharacterized protein LOC128236091 n=1 Tax=Mya arenaria TaxID=6604 RepID=UPI0022E11DB0|nr:uncharacterized protein LOC128236091 [Mya arenaria]
MHSYLSVLFFLGSVGCGLAWYNRYDNAVYGGGWSPDRRSLKSSCLGPQERCMKSYQCCSDERGVQMKCMVNGDVGAGEFGFGQCTPNNQMLEAIRYANGGKFGFKKDGQSCEDSSECYDQCCRIIKMHRMGYKKKCGKSYGDACFQRVYHPNDIFAYDGYNKGYNKN